MFCTYILKCADNSYYIGSTENLKNRINDHNLGKGANFTAKRRPCVIVWFQKFPTQEEAIKKEMEIKKFGRQKKEEIIFAKDSIWEHYKGNKYIILGKIDNLIVYTRAENWKKYSSKKEKKGEQSEAYLRHKDQWLDWIDVKNKKLRFNLLVAV